MGSVEAVRRPIKSTERRTITWKVRGDIASFPIAQSAEILNVKDVC